MNNVSTQSLILGSMSLTSSGNNLLANGNNQFVTSGQTGGFYPSTNPSGYISSFIFPIILETGFSRILTPNDAQTWIRFNNASANTGIISPQVSGAWISGTEIAFEQAGAGQLTITGGTGVTINSSSTFKTFGQYSVIGVKRVSGDSWTLFGERA